MKLILVVYHSQEKGNTRRLAEMVADGCRQPGTRVELVNVHDQRVDMHLAEQADAYALGSPDYYSYMAGGLKQFFDDLCIASWAGQQVTGKPCVLFLTHGGGGEAIHSLEHCAREMTLMQVAAPIICRGAPDPETCAAARYLGRTLAEAVLKEATTA